MDKVRLFLKASVGEEEAERYIKYDHWVRALGVILAEYEAAEQSAKAKGAKSPACKCNAYQLENYGCQCGEVETQTHIDRYANGC